MKTATLSTIVVLLVTIPTVLNRAVPQDETSETDKPNTENEIPQDDVTTTLQPDEDNGEPEESSPSNPDEGDSSSSETTSSSTTEAAIPSPSTRTPPKKNHYGDDGFIIADLKNDYDMFLDFVNQTSQKKLELFDKAVTEVEKELRPGTPLMKVVDWVFGLITQLQTRNNRAKKPNSTQSN